MQIALINYQNLLKRIQEIIGTTEKKIIAEVNYEKVVMGWEIGKIIEDHLLKNNRADYGKEFFKQLESDILISQGTLYQMRNFYKTYRTLPKKGEALSWSHYRNLIAVKNDNQRQYLENLVIEENIGSNQLQKKISQNSKRRKISAKAKITKLKFNRGQLFTYKIASLISSKKAFLDCGFNIFTEVETSLKGEGVVLESVKNGEKISLKKSQLKPAKLYTYKAFVDRVVDGDTLRVTLDLGFKIQHKEILRLAKINAPEARTIEGTKSRAALTKILKDVPFLVIKTNKTDIYGRYIADIFLAKNGEIDAQKVADEGEYLNQMLLDLGVVEVF